MDSVRVEREKDGGCWCVCPCHCFSFQWNNFASTYFKLIPAQVVCAPVFTICVFHVIRTVMEELRVFRMDSECSSSESVAKLNIFTFLLYSEWIQTISRSTVCWFSQLVGYHFSTKYKVDAPCLELKLALNVTTLVYHICKRNVFPQTIFCTGKC